jgi:hypothetical protein
MASDKKIDKEPPTTAEEVIAVAKATVLNCTCLGPEQGQRRELFYSTLLKWEEGQQ